MVQVFDKDKVIQANQFFQLDEKKLADLLALCDNASGDVALCRLAMAHHNLFFHTCMDEDEAAGCFTQETKSLGGRQAAVAALLVISGLEHMREAYRQRGIPGEILCDSLKDLSIWMDDHRERTGETGLTQTGWLLRALRGRLFRLSRLQFMHGPLAANLYVAQHRQRQTAVAFFGQKEKLRGDGLVDGTNGRYDAVNGWESSFRITDGEITGTPVHPGGYAVNRLLRLPAAQWEPAAQHGDGMLDIHIPKDGRMELGQCRDSILEAMAFFTRCFPDQPYRILHLNTWFLDPQLQGLLASDANIVRLQKEFYLFPVRSGDAAAHERIFGRADIDIAAAPEDTALRKAVKHFVLSGNRMREGGGFLLPGHMHRFGSAWYQTACAGEIESMPG